MTLTQGQTIQTRYRVAGLLAQGGFGAVYKGWDVNLNRPIAIKENLDTSPEAQRQFQHEAQILADISHPNLPRVTDHFVITGIGQYLVMDFVDGEDLQAMLNRTGRALPEAQVLAWIDQICEALIYLHEQQPPVIHRDIKPANIKITPKGKAVLVDFGIAKIYDPLLKTILGARAVTPGYSPPEQYGQGKTDVRSDVYSLGATLYTLLTGQEPPESVERVANNAILIPPRQLVPALSQATSDAVLHACEVSTTRRFQTMAELRQVLRAHTSLSHPVLGQTPVPRPQPTPVAHHVPYPQPVPAQVSRGSKSTVKRWWGLIGLTVAGVLIVEVAFFSRALVVPIYSTPTFTVNVMGKVPVTLTPTNAPTSTPIPTSQAQANIYATATAISKGAVKYHETRSGVIDFDKDKQQIGITSDSPLPNVSLADFIAEANFRNSYAISEKDWHYGFAFRWKDASFHVVLVSSQHTWRHIIQQDGVEEIIEEGKFDTPIKSKENEINSLRIIVLGRQGQLWVNGEFVANLDTSRIMNAGNVMITKWDTREDLLKFDRRVEFIDFVIWTLN